MMQRSAARVITSPTSPRPLSSAKRGQQVPARDLLLLLLGVARQPDDLQPVVQRLGDVFLVVGRGDEEHVREVVLQLQVRVAEGVVLDRVQHLHQRRRRVAPPVGVHLVQLVQE